MYLISQACPWYEPEPSEVSDFKLIVMAEIHQVHERVRVMRLAKLLAKMLGATDG